MSKGRLFIISGPSGSGKDSLMSELFKIYPELKFSISSITRPMREGEIEGQKYNFISREKFEQMIADDQLLEYNVYLGNYYGTPIAPVLSAIDNGEDIIVEIDVNGAKQIREKMPDTVSIFILPPSFDELLARLNKRGTESKDKINARLNCALDEIARADEYDYFVINDDFDTAVNDLVSIIRVDRQKASRNPDIISKILNRCEVNELC